MMPVHNYNRAINAAILGYVIVLVALVLNYLAGSKAGVMCAVATLVFTYCNESYIAAGRGVPTGVGLLPLLTCGMSYGLWMSQ